MTKEEDMYSLKEPITNAPVPRPEDALPRPSPSYVPAFGNHISLPRMDLGWTTSRIILVTVFVVMFSLTIVWFVVLGVQKSRRQAAERNQKASPKTPKLLPSGPMTRERVYSTFDAEKAYQSAEISNHNRKRLEKQVANPIPMRLPPPAHTRTGRVLWTCYE
ncbi:hypothetical protein V5O48_005921 [Marasmius crinis-equi]|uniref:Uncharacterized protein n=1 Tax=Marasmius crinis-equi TaxID=585013 RepID=A0ABR3FKY6_9AGAR